MLIIARQANAKLCNDAETNMKGFDKRSHMHPETLQLIMILKLNKSLWASELVIQEILEKTQEQSESEDEDQGDDDERR